MSDEAKARNEAFEQYWERYKASGLTTGYTRTFGDFCAGYEAAASVAADAWVLVSERLPEREGSYLTFCVYYAPDDMPTDYEIKRFVTGTDYGDFIGNGRVIAWREIPPYQQEEK